MTAPSRYGRAGSIRHVLVSDVERVCGRGAKSRKVARHQPPEAEARAEADSTPPRAASGQEHALRRARSCPHDGRRRWPPAPPPPHALRYAPPRAKAPADGPRATTQAGACGPTVLGAALERYIGSVRRELPVLEGLLDEVHVEIVETFGRRLFAQPRPERRLLDPLGASSTSATTRPSSSP